MKRVKIGNCSLFRDDCLNIMPKFPENAIDLILCDLPYGTTQNKWDTIIPFESMWEQYERLIKKDSAIVLTASQPFTSALVMSNIEMFKYAWIWEKSEATGHLNAKRMPMKIHEDALVFFKRASTYNPQGLKRFGSITRRGNNGTNFGV